jgi:hypothetical protein
MGMLLDLQLNERAISRQRRGDDLRAADVRHGLLRHELRVDGRSHRQPDRLWGLGIAIPVATAALSWRLLVRRFLVGDAPEARSG